MLIKLLLLFSFLLMTVSCLTQPELQELEFEQDVDAGVDPIIQTQRNSVQEVFEANCLSCHGNGKQYQSLIDLSVDIKVLEKDQKYIVQRDANSSYLYQKITTGSMSAYTNSSDRNIIKEWINNIQDEEINVTCAQDEEVLDNICVKKGKVIRSYGYRMVTPDELFKDINSIFNLNLKNINAESGLPIVPEPTTTHGFKNQFGLISANSVYINAIANLADDVGVELNNKADFSPSIVSCMDQSVADCGEQLAQSYIPKFFRRPLPDDELEKYRNFFATATGDKKEIFINFFKALIQSPSFLFREEHGANPNPLHQLDAHEVASRLSYFITGQAPDAQLLAVASNNTILNKATREAQAQRLLALDKSKNHLARVFMESIGIDRLAHSEALSNDMKKETQLLIKDIFFATQDKKWTDIFTANYTFINARLANLYQMQVNTDNNNFIKVNYPDNKRSGVLSHGSYLSAFFGGGDIEKTKDIRRGINFYERILCKSMPLPPANVDIDMDPAHDLDGCKLDNRKASTSNPQVSCFQCHQHFDPIGMGFERFNNQGKYREVQADNQSCSTIESFYLSGGQSFETMPEYTQAISQNARVGRCLALRMKSYAYGSETNISYVNSIFLEMNRFKTSMSFKDLIIDIVTHDQFIKRESRDE